jgi:hypothetical protein
VEYPIVSTVGVAVFPLALARHFNFSISVMTPIGWNFSVSVHITQRERSEFHPFELPDFQAALSVFLSTTTAVRPKNG